jgi:hypothetical protein
MPSRQFLPTMRSMRSAFRCAMRSACAAFAIAVIAPTMAAAAPQDAPAPSAASPPPLTGPRPQQDTLGPADEAPGSRNVTVSFTDNFIADRLPFDVPFNVTGAVDTAVRRLDLTVYRVPADVDLAKLINYLQTTVDCVGQQPPGLRVSMSTANTGADGRFSLFVNALDPQYYYAFCFVGATPVPSAEIDADVRRIVAAVLPRTDTGDDISIDLLGDIRAAMRTRIAQLGAGRPVIATIPDGNLFDARPNDPRFAPLVGPLAGPYIQMSLDAAAYNRALDELVTDLAAARASMPISPELVDALPSADLRLPTPESAVTGPSAFDANAFRFDSAKTLLDAALKAASADAAQLKILNGLVDDLNAVVDEAQGYGVNFDSLRGAATALLGFVALEARAVTVTLGSSVLGADLARSAYVSLDAGIAYPWRLETMVFYAGTNIYFRPINKAAPLRYKGTFLHRFALTVGITTTVRDDSRRAEDLRSTPDDEDTSNSLLLGGGVRVTPSLRVGAGVLVFKESDPNPLIDQTSVAVTPYIAFTADVNVAEMFRSLF